MSDTYRRILKTAMLGFFLVTIGRAEPAAQSPASIVILGQEVQDGRTLQYVIPDEKFAVLQFGSFSSYPGDGYFLINAKVVPRISPLTVPEKTIVEIATGKGFLAITLYDMPKKLTTMTPSTSVVIPENATGSFRVVLEASADLVTWTETLPGSFGGASDRRFFRARISLE